MATHGRLADHRHRSSTLQFESSRNCNSVATPTALYRDLDATFNFDHDPCPLQSSPIVDGLDRNNAWGQRNFINPPFNNIGPWLRRAHEESESGGRVSVVLVPMRANTRYWRQWVANKVSALLLIMQRVKFPGYAEGAPFVLCLLVYGNAHSLIGQLPQTVGGHLVWQPNVDVDARQQVNKDNQHVLEEHTAVKEDSEHLPIDN